MIQEIHYSFLLFIALLIHLNRYFISNSLIKKKNLKFIHYIKVGNFERISWFKFIKKSIVELDVAF